MGASRSPGSDVGRLPGWLPPTLLVTLFVVLAAWSWRRWADPIVDFGNEPYVAWQLAEGRALYRDIAWLYGPLSPWINAACFRLFGASLSTLAVCNLVVAGVLAVVVYRFCARSADALTATIATAVLLVSFVFPHHSDDTGNYDFIWPYAYAATHGTALLVCGVALLARAVVGDRIVSWAGAGVLLGATMLTKAEIALAATAAAGAASVWRFADGRPRALGRLAALAAGAAVPVVACASRLGLDAIVAPWTAVARVMGGDHAFNAHLMGTDALGAHLVRLALDAAVWSVLAGVLVALDVRARALPAERKRWLVIGAVAVVGALIVRDLPGVGRPLPVLIPLALAALVAVARRRPTERARLAPLVVWGAAAWTLLARMVLDVHLHHYGFYLCLPAAVFVIVLGAGTVPRLLATRAGGGAIVRPVALATVGLLLLYSAALSATSYAHVTVPIGHARDAMYAPAPVASPTGTLAAALLARIDADVPPHATLAVLPDGPLVNFLTRRPNPTPYHQLMPPTLVTFGADRVVASYEARAPDYVLVYDWPGDEYGVGAFGSREWGAEIVDFVARRYERMSAVPSSATSIGFTLWRRRATS